MGVGDRPRESPAQQDNGQDRPRGRRSSAPGPLMKVNEILLTWLLGRYDGHMSDPIQWMGTREACERLGVTLRTLYRFIDEGQLPAYKMGRVIRVQASDVDDFISRMRIEPGTLEHLYPEPKPREARSMAVERNGDPEPEEGEF